ncbi:MAG TPA: protein translocase subunit SecD, partial [Anaerolineales bacterium]|nr:protein translocase subunit SecD [Anaerolineales bacterium]
FVDTGDYSPDPGTVLKTDFVTGSDTLPTPEGTDPAQDVVYHTIMTGQVLDSVNVSAGQVGGAAVDFVLTPEGRTIFAQHTAANTNKYLTITLDKVVVSSPIIQNAIPDGLGQISGGFTPEGANALAVQLRYGSLPIPLKVVETRIIGPTLGEDSLQKSLLAGMIGMIIVILFMVIYYRLPGIVAALSILFYAAISYAIFKYFHFTLTLPGIAGFLLSTGAALDANILIFERLKEELRNGRSLTQAVDQGWTRAWSSIRDSNLSAIITSLILYWFGSNFGATIVKGFSLTLALGVAISLFTAIYVSRTLLTAALQNFKPKNLEFWFGL